jgi:Domain of unknown function DUF11
MTGKAESLEVAMKKTSGLGLLVAAGLVCASLSWFSGFLPESVGAQPIGCPSIGSLAEAPTGPATIATPRGAVGISFNCSRPDLKISITQTEPSSFAIDSGQEFTQFVTVANNGESDASDVTVRYDLPKLQATGDVAAVLETRPEGGFSCSTETGGKSITCRRGTVQAGKTVNIRFHMKAPVRGGDLVSGAVVNPPANPAGTNATTQLSSVLGLPDLSVHIDEFAGIIQGNPLVTFFAGGQGFVVVSVENIGDARASSTLQVFLPPGLDPIGAIGTSPDDFICPPGFQLASGGSCAAGSTKLRFPAISQDACNWQETFNWFVCSVDLQPGAGATLSLEFHLPEIYSDVVTARVDPGNQVKEIREDNNRDSITVHSP